MRRDVTRRQGDLRVAHDDKRMGDRDSAGAAPPHRAARRRCADQGDAERQGIVEITLRDGREIKHHTKPGARTAENPMTRAEVDAKSYELMAPVIGKARARKLCDGVWRLEKVRDLRVLRPLLRA